MKKSKGRYYRGYSGVFSRAGILYKHDNVSDKHKSGGD